MTTLERVVLGVAIACIAGCGRLSFRDGEGKEVGLKVYSPKPYLVVARTGAKDKPVDVQVHYLPDLSAPTYIRPLPGWGSANLSVNLANGMLTSFGQVTDPKIVELLGAIGGVATSFATAKKTLAEAAAVEQAVTIEDGTKLRLISEDVARLLRTPAAADLLGTERAVLDLAAKQLGDLGTAIVDPGKPKPDPAALSSRLEGIARSMAQVRTESPIKPLGDLLKQFAALRASVESVAQATRSGGDPPLVEVYEIDNSSGRTLLRRVDVDVLR
jgi:hypothetical protein